LIFEKCDAPGDPKNVSIFDKVVFCIERNILQFLFS